MENFGIFRIDQKKKLLCSLRRASVAGLAALLFTLNIGSAFAQTDDGTENGIGLNIYSTLSGAGAYYIEQSNFYSGFETWVNARIDKKLGKSVSFFADISVALIHAERKNLGKSIVMFDNPEEVDIYSNPLAYFPYAYESAWGGFVFSLDHLTGKTDTGITGWPDKPAIGFTLLSEISGSALDEALKWRIGRTKHEAAAVIEGYSLALNNTAQPFFGFDLQIDLSSVNLYYLTGMLEYYNSLGKKGIYECPLTFQNAFSLFLLNYKFKDFLQIDFGSSAVWPKRFEMAYLYPFTIPLLYKNIGDFDNLSVFGNLKLQYPGLGFVWISGFLDEMDFKRDLFILDREMYAIQAGLRYFISSSNSTMLTLSYTKIEPYCYTHQKEEVPWYNRPMEQAYLNHGYGLGYYLPPNSDEVKLVFSTMIKPQTPLNIQFQMIRHGAEYGSGWVDGSSYVSELKTSDRDTDPRLRKYFLHDGAYQWQYVIKAGSKLDLKGPPFSLALFGDIGTVLSYFTNIESGKNNAGKWYSNSIVDTTEYPEYPKSTAIILNLTLKASLR